MSEHTPGPWLIESHNPCDVVSDVYDVEICTIQPVDLGGRKMWEYGNITKANANLIAAAPDLLAALDRLAKWAEVMAEAQTCEHTGDHPIAIARATLIKALTGESK